MRSRNDSAQITPPPSPIPGKEGHPRGRLIDKSPSPHRDPTPPHGLLRPRQPERLHGQLHPEQGTHPRRRAGLGEPNRTSERVTVGESQGVHAPLGGALGQPLRVRGPVAQGEPGGGVQMRETRHTHLPHS
ncbi:putative DNA polymerase III, alpha chain [Streptomyces viridochromogenes Tue57]|uniref:Putative DNA polymerase III, alpha chain n=1 Tax=Streptomyces viridochromogenes Tue57 TaxID=1160705 RepID=L8P6T7_STRVR|nr:putative DNA polymerase III, alpha chain [Streptomyces viridochromogenes Tue57]